MNRTSHLGIRSHLLLAVAALAGIAAPPCMAGAAERPLYADPNQPVEKRIDDLIGRMTLEEKAKMVYANSTFSAAGVERLGVPDLWMDDGPMGVREEVGPGFRNMNRNDDFATAMPVTLGLAATWNVELANAYGAVVGQEAYRRGKNLMLGPSVCIQRTPLCGRNFEYMGEDPYLAARICVGYIKGEQAQGVGSTVKHFAANNQETQRSTINVIMDERTLREIYLPAFRAAITEANSLGIMGAYNKFRGQWCCENDYLLNKVLKGEWGFKGLVMSDWGGVHTTDLAALNGMDLEMGTRTSPPYEQARLGTAFLDGLKSGKYPVAALDEKVRRRLHVMFQLKMLDDPKPAPPAPLTAANPLSTKEHQTTARLIAEEAAVLLKNEGAILPLDAAKLKTVAIIGENANTKFAAGGGSANIKAPYEITALEGIRTRLGANVKIIEARGYTAGGAAGGRRGGAGGGAAPADPALADEAVAAAKAADVVIYVGGLNHNLDQEGRDRPDLKMPGGQDDLIPKIVAANPKTIIVLCGGGAVEMDAWLGKVPAVLYDWYGGLEAGNALARVLFGDVNPSGKLPCTFPRKLADSPAHAGNDPAMFPGQNGTEEYKEGLLVGYRWFDTRKIEPLFPFGFGLSYTKFEYSGLSLLTKTGDGPVPDFPISVLCEVANTGARDGAEVVEVYVHQANPALPRPEKELKGFAKVFLKAGEKKTVAIPLNREAFAYYDPARSGWVAEQGEYTIMVGASSRDIRLRDTWKLAQTTVAN